MYIYIYVYIFILCMYVYLSIYLFNNLYLYVCIYMCIFVCICTKDVYIKLSRSHIFVYGCNLTSKLARVHERRELTYSADLVAAGHLKKLPCAPQ